MSYVEFSINIEAITPVTIMKLHDDEDLSTEITLNPGENYAEAYQKTYFQEFQSNNMDVSLPIIPQIVEKLYDSDSLPISGMGWYIKSGLIKVKIVNYSDGSESREGTDKLQEYFSRDWNDESIEFGTELMFEYQLNEAIKEYYGLNDTKFIINYNKTLPRVIQ